MLTTIGYERSGLEDFLATLTQGGVDVLVDVRDRAQSRLPGFSKTALAAAVNEVGIEYIHMPALGDPKPGREAARAGNFEAFRAIFDDVLKTNEAQSAMIDLVNLARNKRICLMCFERDQRHCHRLIVANRLEIPLQTKAMHLGVSRGAARRAA